MRIVFLQILVASLGLCCAASEPEPARSTVAQDLSIPWETPLERDKRLAFVADAQAPLPVERRPLESCGNSGEGFDGWIETFRQHAAAQQISVATVTAALKNVRYNGEVVELDRSQEVFRLSLADFSKKHLTRTRIAQGVALRREHAPLLARIEVRFGVPSEILVAIWGLETDYGQNVGSRSCLSALATLAYDCRRAERFRGELLSALRIVERGDLTPDRMVGAWAGELGQTQFLPSSYERSAIDFDGDGRADLVGSSADALASTANYLQQHGWHAREGFGPRSHNFGVLAEWNASEVYRQTIAQFAATLGKKK
jgi:lytic murein transglycosylase